MERSDLELVVAVRDHGSLAAAARSELRAELVRMLWAMQSLDAGEGA